MATHYIVLDGHCQFMECAAVTSSGRVTKRGHLPATIPAMVTVINAMERPRQAAFEEAPMAE